jgi:hypothetical protein
MVWFINGITRAWLLEVRMTCAGLLLGIGIGIGGACV